MFENDGLFMEKPSLGVDIAWNALVESESYRVCSFERMNTTIGRNRNLMIISVNSGFYIHLPVNETESHDPKEDVMMPIGQEYTATISAYHELHCLVCRVSSGAQSHLRMH